MKVNIVEIGHETNKDCMGSFGLGFALGGGVFAKMAGWAKSKMVRIPDVQTAFLAGIHHVRGDGVIVSREPLDADLYYIHTSLGSHDKETAVARRLREIAPMLFYLGLPRRHLRDHKGDHRARQVAQPKYRRVLHRHSISGNEAGSRGSLHN